MDRALSASSLLDDRIAASLSPGSDGQVWFEPELARLARIVLKVGYGLYCLKYGLGANMNAFNVKAIIGPGQSVPPNMEAAQWVWPGIRRKRWVKVQDGVFHFLFAKGWLADDPPLWCLMNLYDTLLVGVACPAPIGRAPGKRLRSKAW